MSQEPKILKIERIRDSRKVRIRLSGEFRSHHLDQVACFKHSRERKNGMAIQEVKVQRFSLTTSRSFEEVVASLKAGVGRLDLAAFVEGIQVAGHPR